MDTAPAPGPVTVRELHRAIDRRQLMAWYQPIVRLSDGVIRGFEALVRWNHPRHGLLPAGAFVPMAERSGAIRQVDEWMWHEVMAQVGRWQADVVVTPAFRVTMNMSAVDLETNGLAGAVGRAIDQTDVDPRGLCFELTETRLVTDLDAAKRTAGQLRDLGVGLALDDFGSQWATFDLLRSLPFDLVKIDRSIVAALGTDLGRAMVTAMVDTARHLPATVLAEGVETFDQAHRARQLGCDEGQGHWWSVPMAGDAAESALLGGTALVAS